MDLTSRTDPGEEHVLALTEQHGFRNSHLAVIWLRKCPVSRDPARSRRFLLSGKEFRRSVQGGMQPMHKMILALPTVTCP